jgi:hypothetical protein
MKKGNRMLIKPNWEIFKAKFSENPQDNFEWFCYLLFSKEYNQPYGTHRYKNQSGIETDPIEVKDEVIGWQSKFYNIPKVETLNKDLKETLRKAKRDYPHITKIVFYTNMEWTKYHKNKDTKAEKTVAHKEIEELFKKEKVELVLRMDSHFESLFVCQEQREVSRYFFERDTKWELTPYGFVDTLKSKYLNDFKTISLLTKTQKLIDEIFINLSLIEDTKDEDIKKVISHESFLDRDDFPHDEDDFMDISELLNQSSKSLIYGTAGIGKTTLCKYISYMWAKRELYQEFDYVVYIPLRKWDSTQLKEVIRSYYYSQYNEEIDLDIKENSNKILFLFDGYDELKPDKREGLYEAIRDNNLTHYIITTRPYGYEKNNFLDVKQHFETVGFTPKNVEEYIESFFENEKEQQGLRDFLDANINIKALRYIPLMLEMICLMWEQKSFDSNMTMTELYSQVIEDILEKHSQDERVYEWENRENIKELLGKIAFEGLIKQTILFDGKLIRDNIGRDKVNFFKESIINSGFLKSDRKDKSLLGNNFEFLHLTFQEYFSALYVSKLTEKEQQAIISEYKFYPHFQVFFVFLAGLIQNKTLLIEEIGNEPKDIIGFYEILFIMNVSSEIKAEELSKTTLENINKKLQRQIEITCRNDSHYDTIFENLKKVTHIINDDTIEMLLDMIELDVDDYIKEEIVDTFFSLSKCDEKYKKYIEQIETKSDNESIKQYIYDVINKTEEKEAKEFQSIVKALESTSFRGGNVYDTLELIQNGEKADIEIEKAIMNIFEKYNISDYQKWITENLDELSSLGSIVIEDGSAMNELKLNSQDEFIDLKIREESLKVIEIIEIIERNSENVVEELINYIKNGNPDEDTVLLIIEYIDEIIKDKDYFVFLLIELWEDKNIDDNLKFIFVYSIEEYTERSNDKVTDIIITACEKKLAYAVKYFSRVEKYDNEYIDRFIKLLENEEFYENHEYIHDICENFGKIAEKNFYAHIKLIELSEKELKENVSIEYGLFLDFYLWSVKTSVLFQDYDEEVSIHVCLFEHITYNNKVLFIENNKLCTIEDGKKIYTQRDVDSEFLEEWEALLDGDELDD